MKLSAVLLFGCVVASAAPYCDAPGAVAAELRRAAGLWDRSGPQKARIDDTRSILEALVRKYPDDIQANRRFQNDSRIPQEELIARYKERLNGEALPTYFYALTLISRDTPEAMRLFAQALAKDPDLAWAHMAMSFVYNHGRFKDKAKATEHVDAFFELCPTSYDFYSNRLLGFHGTPAVQKRVVSALRARVEAETDADLLGVYEHLWNLEFKLTSPAEHGSVRVRIISDIDRIRRMSPEPMPARVRLIRDGLWQAKDKAGATAMDDEILRRFSMTPEAEKIAVARWRKANRDERKPGYWTELYRASAEWIERWPWEPSGYGDRFAAARKLKDLPASEMKAAANGLLNFLRGNEVMYGFQPFAHQAAEEYLERGIHLAEVPRLAEEGLTLERDREVAEEKSDMDLPANPEQAGAALRAAAIGAVDLLAQSYLKLGVAEKTGELEKRLDALEAIMPFEKALKMQAASRVAELDGRKMDAFVYLEKALGVAPKALAKKRETELRRLWTALGGTDKTWALRTNATVREAKEAADWKAPEKKMAAWDLVDLGGKRWTSDQLAGKTVFINVWATWCGPCKAEHPHFQKLYERVKDQKDVAVISFNVDDRVGLVQSYLTEGKYTFPVMLASRFVDDTLDSVSIPRNWLVDKRGAHQLEQIGFGESADWVERMAAEIEKLK